MVSAALAARWPMVAHAELTLGEQSTVVQTVTTSTYLNGGIALDEKAAMRGLAKDFPLRIVFSEAGIASFWPTLRW